MDFAQIGWVDMLLLAVLAVSVIVGLIRGFVFEVLSLAGWIAAWFAAQWFAPVAAPYVPLGVPGSALNLGAAFAAVFVAALIVWAFRPRRPGRPTASPPRPSPVGVAASASSGRTATSCRTRAVPPCRYQSTMRIPLGHKHNWR